MRRTGRWHMYIRINVMYELIWLIDVRKHKRNTWNCSNSLALYLTWTRDQLDYAGFCSQWHDLFICCWPWWRQRWWWWWWWWYYIQYILVLSDSYDYGSRGSYFYMAAIKAVITRSVITLIVKGSLKRWHERRYRGYHHSCQLGCHRECHIGPFTQLAAQLPVWMSSWVSCRAIYAADLTDIIWLSSLRCLHRCHNICQFGCQYLDTPMAAIFIILVLLISCHLLTPENYFLLAATTHTHTYTHSHTYTHTHTHRANHCRGNNSVGQWTADATKQMQN